MPNNGYILGALSPTPMYWSYTASFEGSGKGAGARQALDGLGKEVCRQVATTEGCSELGGGAATRKRKLSEGERLE